MTSSTTPPPGPMDNRRWEPIFDFHCARRLCPHKTESGTIRHNIGGEVVEKLRVAGKHALVILDSGSSSRKGVEVQVLSSAPIQDILLIETSHGLDYVRAADAAKRVFAARGTHSFPSEFVMPAEWRPEIEALVTQLGFAETPAASIEERFRFVLQRLAEAALR
jgi:hypothetical protein